jgi:hypothetical protein
MVAVVVFTALGWLVVFAGLLAAPPSALSRDGGPGFGDAQESPAVVSLLAGRLGRDGFAATLLDLSARGWFRLAPPQGARGPVMCVVPTEAPVESLTPYEQRVIAHVAARAAQGGVVPAPALSDGFESGQTGFMKVFGGEVAADARARLLTRPRLSPRRIALLCALLLVPAGALLFALNHAHRPDATTYAAVSFVAGCWLTIGVGTSKRCSAPGQAVLERWRAAAAAQPGGDGRLLAYAAALGAAPAAVAAFASPGGNVAWSNYRGGWQQIAIETNTGSGRAALGCLAAAIGGPLLFVGVVSWLAMNGLGPLVGDLGGLIGFLFLGGLVVWALRGRLFPRVAEFDGQVIRQWMVKGGDDSPDQYHLAIDDGARAKAWDLLVGSELYRQATPGALVHARVNLWSRRSASVWLVQPAAVAPPLAEPGALRDPRGPVGAVSGTPPDPGSYGGALPGAPRDRRGYGDGLPGAPRDPRGAGGAVAGAPFDPRGHGPTGASADG